MNHPHLETIDQLVQRLVRIAVEPEAWKNYQVGNEGKNVVIDRAENQIHYYLRELDLILTSSE